MYSSSYGYLLYNLSDINSVIGNQLKVDVPRFLHRVAQLVALQQPHAMNLTLLAFALASIASTHGCLSDVISVWRIQHSGVASDVTRSRAGLDLKKEKETNDPMYVSLCM